MTRSAVEDDEEEEGSKSTAISFLVLSNLVLLVTSAPQASNDTSNPASCKEFVEWLKHQLQRLNPDECGCSCTNEKKDGRNESRSAVDLRRIGGILDINQGIEPPNGKDNQSGTGRESADQQTESSSSREPTRNEANGRVIKPIVSISFPQQQPSQLHSTPSQSTDPPAQSPTQAASQRPTDSANETADNTARNRTTEQIPQTSLAQGENDRSRTNGRDGDDTTPSQSTDPPAQGSTESERQAIRRPIDLPIFDRSRTNGRDGDDTSSTSQPSTRPPAEDSRINTTQLAITLAQTQTGSQKPSQPATTPSQSPAQGSTNPSTESERTDLDLAQVPIDSQTDISHTASNSCSSCRGSIIYTDRDNANNVVNGANNMVACSDPLAAIINSRGIGGSNTVLAQKNNVVVCKGAIIRGGVNNNVTARGCNIVGARTSGNSLCNTR